MELFKVSEIDPVPELLAGVIPEIAALVHVKDTPETWLVGAYENVVPLQIAAGVRPEFKFKSGYIGTITLLVVEQPLIERVYI